MTDFLVDPPVEVGPPVDLVAEPPDPELLARMSYRTALREGWCPWRRIDDGVAVVTSRPPTPGMVDVVRLLYGAREVTFHATTHDALWLALEIGHREHLLFESQDRLADDRPEASARAGLTTWQQWTPVVLLAVVGVMLVVDARATVGVLLTVATLLFAGSILFKVLASVLVVERVLVRRGRVWREAQERLAQGLSPRWRARIRDEDLPLFTVLIPAFREANVVSKVLANMGALDYPRDKLEVMLLLEQDDAETIAVARAMDPPDYVRIVVVPPGKPQTKPRACNYGLAFARGKYVVIFDAEDRPEPDQLRVAVDAFERDAFEREHGLSRRPPLAVAQASLHYFNADYNVLTRMFAIEYAHWFEAMLPGMEQARLPLPLGGTSNHFDTDLLRTLGGWDPYNVTEDADAGLRVSVMGYRVAVIPSSTGEEACAETAAWIRQRTRWIKGYMITAAVNTRHPLRFARQVGFRGVVGMLGLIAATPIAFMSYPLALLYVLSGYLGLDVGGVLLPASVVDATVVAFLAGNVTMILSAMVATAVRYNWRVAVFAIFCPVYWLLHSVAAWRAFFQVLRDPHRWEKTPHGLTEDYESDAHV